MNYIGIDPGASGGIAVVTPVDGTGRKVAVRTFKMPETEADVRDLLQEYRQDVVNPAPAVAVIEHVWSTPGQGGAFKFGMSVGGLRVHLTWASIPFDPVLPRTWQKAMGVTYAKGLTDVQKKNITKRRAQQIFPTLTITHAIADAVLMAEYCRRIHQGRPSR